MQPVNENPARNKGIRANKREVSGEGKSPFPWAAVPLYLPVPGSCVVTVSFGERVAKHPLYEQAMESTGIKNREAPNRVYSLGEASRV